MGYTDSDRNDDFQWFIDNYESLFKRYGISWLAIKNQTVIGAYSDLKSALNEKRGDLGDFSLQFCNGEESGYTNYFASNVVGVA